MSAGQCGLAVLVCLAGDAVERDAGGAREVEVADGREGAGVGEAGVERDGDGVVGYAGAGAAVGAADCEDGGLRDLGPGGGCQEGGCR